jgi:hypothetical protein
MDIKEVVREATAVWYEIKKESIAQEDMDGITKIVEIMTRGGAAREYTEGVQRLLEGIVGQEAAPIPVPPVYAPEQDPEKLERKLRKQRVQYRVHIIKELHEIAQCLEGTVCPMTLLGEYPRLCLQGACEWWEEARGRCGIIT